MQSTGKKNTMIFAKDFHIKIKVNLSRPTVPIKAKS